MNKIDKAEKIEFERNVLLRDITTMKVGGLAKYYFVAKNAIDLVQAVSQAVEQKMSYFILGGGSNVIISDSGFNGLVIKNEARDILVDEAHSIIQTDSGVPSGKVASVAASNSLSGAEYLFGIPGTIGGAVYGNAGLRGHETKEILKDAVVLIVKEDNKPVIVRKKKEWFEYAYRESKLKRNKNTTKYPPVLISVRLQLYPARREVIMERTKEFLGHRRGGKIAGSSLAHAWQPTGLNCSGCIFRNPSDDPMQAAGKLLDEAGVKKLTEGGAAVAKQHANYIYNKNEAKAKDVYDLIVEAQNKVKEKFDVNLDLEVELVGEFNDKEKKKS